MTDEEPKATIRVFKDGEQYYATLSAETPHGLLEFSAHSFGKTSSPNSAIEWLQGALKGVAARSGRGRKPRDYRKICDFVDG